MRHGRIADVYRAKDAAGRPLGREIRHRTERERLACHLDVRYGSQPKETLDIFAAEAPGAPVHLFIHDGYWQNLDKKDFSHLADALVAAGITVMVVNYDLAPAVDVDEIVRQNRAALVPGSGSMPPISAVIANA